MSNTQRITAQHLRYLVALVSECHVTRAAQQMGIGQPAMSAALSRLRVLFNDPLLIKTTYGMEATPRARELARRAQDAIELLSGAQRHSAAFDPATTTGQFNLMASEGISSLLIPPLMQRIRAAAPHLRLSVGVRNIDRTAEYLRDGEIDLVLASIQNPAPDLYQTLLYPQRLYCIASKSHKQIQGSLTLEQFLEQPHVVWGAPPMSFPTLEAGVDDALRKKGKARQVALHVSSMSSTPAIVAGTDLLAVIPERIAVTASKSLGLQVLELPFDVAGADITMLWHERWHRAPSHTWLRGELRNVASDLIQNDRRKRGAGPAD